MEEMCKVDYSDVKFLCGAYQGVAHCEDWTTYLYYIAPDAKPTHSNILVRSIFEGKYIASFNIKKWKL